MNKREVSGSAPRLVICDDDPIVRAVIRHLADDIGMEVVAEVDNSDDALDAVIGHDADEIILDLALAAGRGEEVISKVNDRGLWVRMVVFSAFVVDPEPFLARGVDAVVDKPDFEHLERVLAHHVEGVRSNAEMTVDAAVGAAPFEPAAPVDGAAFMPAPHGMNQRRERPSRRHLPPVPAVLSPSGLTPPSSRDAMLSGLSDGDAILALEVADSIGMARQYGPLVVADHRLHTARIASTTLRDDDRIVATGDGEILVILTDAFPEGGKAVFDRIRSAWESSSTLGGLVAGWAIHRGDQSADVTVRKAVNALHRAGAEEPLCMA